jgi:hypothetical protein
MQMDQRIATDDIGTVIHVSIDTDMFNFFLLSNTDKFDGQKFSLCLLVKHPDVVIETSG